MSFNDNVAEHLKELGARLKKLRWERIKLFHDCDCDYCDRNDSAEDEERLEELDKEIAEVEATIKRLKDWAKLHKIEIAEEVKV